MFATSTRFLLNSKDPLDAGVAMYWAVDVGLCLRIGEPDDGEIGTVRKAALVDETVRRAEPAPVQFTGMASLAFKTRAPWALYVKSRNTFTLAEAMALVTR